MVGGGARESSARREGVQGRTSRTFGPSNIIGYDRTPTRASSVAHAPQCALIFFFFYWRRPACVLNLRTRRRPTEGGCPCGARPIRPLRRDGSRVSPSREQPILFFMKRARKSTRHSEKKTPTPRQRAVAHPSDRDGPTTRWPGCLPRTRRPRTGQNRAGEFVVWTGCVAAAASLAVVGHVLAAHATSCTHNPPQRSLLAPARGETTTQHNKTARRRETARRLFVHKLGRQ